MEEIENCLRNEEQLDCRRHIRGFLEPCLLLLLHLHDSYGYDLTTTISTFGLGNVDSSLVYRMLRELESAGLVDSEWEAGRSMGPARRVYGITSAGESHLDDWIQTYETRIGRCIISCRYMIATCWLARASTRLLEGGGCGKTAPLSTIRIWMMIQYQ